MKGIRFHEAPRREGNLATLWYAERSVYSAQNFCQELLSAFAKAGKFPHRYPSYLHGTQRILLSKFPYAVVYLDWDDVVFIIAIAHAKRRPGLWTNRLLSAPSLT